MNEWIGVREVRDGMEKKEKRGCSSRAVVEMVPKTKHLGKSEASVIYTLRDPREGFKVHLS